MNTTKIKISNFKLIKSVSKFEIEQSKQKKTKKGVC